MFADRSGQRSLMPMSRKPSWSAKSLKSFKFRVASGRSRTRQHAVIQVSFTGRGRPRRSARACSSPQRTATSSEYGNVTTCCRQSASSASLRGPQLRNTVHLVSSPTVTKEMHQVSPVSRARSGSSRRPRRLPDATSVSGTTKLTPGRNAGKRRGQPGIPPTPHRSRTAQAVPCRPLIRPAGRLGDGLVPPPAPHRQGRHGYWFRMPGRHRFHLPRRPFSHAR